MKGVLLLLLASATVSASASAGADGLELDPSVVDLSKFTRDGQTSRYLGPDGAVLSIDEEKTTPEQARKDLKNRLLQLQLLFAPHGAAYPGMLTKDASCKDKTRLGVRTRKTNESLYWFSELRSTQGCVYGSSGTDDQNFWSEK